VAKAVHVTTGFSNPLQGRDGEKLGSLNDGTFERYSHRFLTTREKLRVNAHFLDIIDLKFEQKMPYILIYFKAFSNNGCLSVSEKYVVTHSFLLGS